MKIIRRAIGFFQDKLRSVLFRLMEVVVPIKANRWCFATWPGAYAHTLDNPRAVFEEVRDNPEIEKVILRRAGQVDGTARVEGVNVKVVEVESLVGAYMVASCGCLLTGYALSGLASYSRYLKPHHKIIQLWHGIPLKRIGKLFPGESLWDAETYKYAATVCSSTRDQELMAQAFAPLPKERVWQTGLPRNSTILKPDDSLPWDYKAHLSRLREMLRGRRLVLYAPTWREQGVGIYEFSHADENALDAVLAKHNAVLGIRAHANRRTIGQDGGVEPRVLQMNDFPDVNVVLRETAVLITDYSSIYIDFLVTGRPVIHFTYDLESYVAERGFLYSLDEALAAKPSLTATDMIGELDLALGGQYAHKAQYAKALALFHEHGGNTAAQVASRICDLVGVEGGRLQV